jgi:hypothetical protein
MQARALRSFLLQSHRRAVVLATLVGLLACAPKPQQGEGSGLQYALMGSTLEATSRWSILRDIDQARGQLSILVVDKSPGVSRGDNAPLVRRAADFIRRAVEKWNVPLAGVDGWKWSEVDVTMVDENADNHVTKIDRSTLRPAEDGARACRLDPASWLPSRPGLLVVVLDSSCGRSFALPWARVIVLAGPELRADNNRLERVVLHEYGHIVGLGDTYDEPGYQSVVGQPDSVMRTAAHLDLEPDDIAGVRALWDHISNGKSPCGSGYTPQEVFYHARLCAPSGGEGSGGDSHVQGQASEATSGSSSQHDQASTASQHDSGEASTDSSSIESSQSGGSQGRWIDPYSGRSFPYCTAAAIDPDGDGWGWENQASCKMAATSEPAGGATSGSGGAASHGGKVCTSIDVSAGPIFSNADASRVCPSVCGKSGRTWNGNWMTTQVNVDSVCGCNICQ